MYELVDAPLLPHEVDFLLQLVHVDQGRHLKGNPVAKISTHETAVSHYSSSAG